MKKNPVSKIPQTVSKISSIDRIDSMYDALIKEEKPSVSKKIIKERESLRKKYPPKAPSPVLNFTKIPNKKDKEFLKSCFILDWILDDEYVKKSNAEYKKLFKTNRINGTNVEKTFEILNENAPEKICNYCNDGRIIVDSQTNDIEYSSQKISETPLPNKRLNLLRTYVIKQDGLPDQQFEIKIQKPNPTQTFKLSDQEKGYLKVNGDTNETTWISHTGTKKPDRIKLQKINPILKTFRTLADYEIHLNPINPKDNNEFNFTLKKKEAIVKLIDKKEDMSKKEIIKEEVNNIMNSNSTKEQKMDKLMKLVLKILKNVKK